MPLPFHTLVPCAGCGCHVALKETVCPHCGAPTRTPDGAVPRTKVAVLMGLTAALLQPIACGSDIDRPESGTSSNEGGNGGDLNVGSAYGVGPSTGTGGDMNVGSAYGVGPSTSSTGTGGFGGQGGVGGDINTGGAYGGGPSVGGEGGEGG